MGALRVDRPPLWTTGILKTDRASHLSLLTAVPLLLAACVQNAPSDATQDQQTAPTIEVFGPSRETDGIESASDQTEIKKDEEP